MEIKIDEKEMKSLILLPRVLKKYKVKHTGLWKLPPCLKGS